MARPSVYETKIKPYLEQIQALRAVGTDMNTIAKMLGTTKKTLYNHLDTKDEFLHSFKKGTEEITLSLENSLYSLAKGTYVKVTEKTTKDSTGNIIRIDETKEYGMPNLGAVIFTLTNIASDKWKNKREETVKFDDEEITESFENVIRTKNEESIQ